MNIITKKFILDILLKDHPESNNVAAPHYWWRDAVCVCELLVQTNEHQNIKKEIKQTIFSFNVPILKNPPHGKNLLQC